LTYAFIRIPCSKCYPALQLANAITILVAMSHTFYLSTSPAASYSLPSPASQDLKSHIFHIYNDQNVSSRYHSCKLISLSTIPLLGRYTPATVSTTQFMYQSSFSPGLFCTMHRCNVDLKHEFLWPFECCYIRRRRGSWRN
jgi:hypothetical protein